MTTPGDNGDLPLVAPTSPDEAGPRGVAAAGLYAVAAAALGLAIHQADGDYALAAIRLVLSSLALSVLALAAVALVLPPRARPAGAKLVTLLLALLLVVQFALLLRNRPDSDAHSFLNAGGLAALPQYRVMLLMAGGLTALGVFASLALPGRSFLARAWFPAVLLVFFCLGVWVLVFTRQPEPAIDVWQFQQRGAEALLGGENPYEIDDYKDIYGSGLHDAKTGQLRQEVYGRGISDGERLAFGFPYMPLTLYLAAAGRAAMNDVRYAHLLAMVVAAAFIRRAGRNAAVAALAAVLLLFTPRAFFVLINGWTEPFNVMLLAATVYCAARRPKLLPVALGLLIAVKQYLILALPLTVLLVPQRGAVLGVPLPDWRRWLRLVLVAGAVALAVTLPLALWNFGRFFFSAYEVQGKAPFRWDALSYLVHRAWGRGEPSRLETLAWPGVAVGLATALCLWRAPRTPAGFAGAAGFVHLALFAFSKQAFANYYYFVIGAFCCAAAAAAAPAGPWDEESAPEEQVARDEDSAGDGVGTRPVTAAGREAAGGTR